jgi:uncharacterized protein YggE
MRPSLFLSSIFLLLVINSNLPAQELGQDINQITVNGSVELKEKADVAWLNFSIKGVGETLRMAVDEAEIGTRQLTEKLNLLGIQIKNISTSEFYSGENYGDKAFLSDSRDYKAVIVTLIKVDSLEILKHVIFAISEAEIENMSSISFSLKDELSFRRKARQEAGLKAMEKAEDITKALGVKLGSVIYIEEVQSTKTYAQQNQSWYMNRGIPNPFNVTTRGGRLDEVVVDESIGSGFFAQTVSITSQVKVTFELENE